jgi:Mg2+/citrate symporter
MDVLKKHNVFWINIVICLNMFALFVESLLHMKHRDMLCLFVIIVVTFLGKNRKAQQLYLSQHSGSPCLPLDAKSERELGY